MIHALHLRWIVPLTFSFGFCIGGIIGAGGDPYD